MNLFFQYPNPIQDVSTIKIEHDRKLEGTIMDFLKWRELRSYPDVPSDPDLDDVLPTSRSTKLIHGYLFTI